MPALRPLAWLFAGAAGAAGCTEIALRLARFEHRSQSERASSWSTERDAELRSERGLLRFDEEELWTLRAGAAIPGIGVEHVNADGFRGPRMEKQRAKGPLRIAILGGDAAFGAGVRFQDTFAAQLDERLRERGVEAEVLCAGVPNATVRQALERYRTEVRPYLPHLVIAAIGDELGCQPAPGWRTDAEKIEQQRAAPDGGAIEHGLRQEVRLLHLASWLRDLASGAYWRERFLALDRERRASGAGAMDWAGVRRIEPHELEPTCDALLDAVRSDGAHLFVLSLPRDPSVEEGIVPSLYVDALAAWSSESRVPFVDARLALYAAVQSQALSKDDLFVHGDPSACMHTWIARSLAEEIERRAKAQPR